MEAFFRTHTYLVEHLEAPVRRVLMDQNQLGKTDWLGLKAHVELVKQPSYYNMQKNTLELQIGNAYM